MIFIFFEQFILFSIQKQKKKERQKSKSEACELNVWACEHVEKVLRHVTHAQGTGLAFMHSPASHVLLVIM